MQIVEVTENKGALCARILATLPTWFGNPESNAAYERDVERMPVFAAIDAGEAIGFLALNRHTAYAQEIHVMGVRPEHHRSGAGRALVTAAETFARAQGARFLTVKTLSPSHPDPGYVKTRAFYEGVGFFPIEEVPLLWGPENPALMLIKTL
ncbi:MAG TPA: GNAT family N-acetyltransferase [Rhizomicrobium sp.]|jgi:GNAT superfamily N-acetyltransferase